MMSHKEETKIVKESLAKVEIAAKVGHSTGTGWGWLKINLGPRQGKHMKAGENGEVIYLTQEEAGKLDIYYPCLWGCPVCEIAKKLRDRVMDIVLAVTERKDDSKIIILEQ